MWLVFSPKKKKSNLVAMNIMRSLRFLPVSTDETKKPYLLLNALLFVLLANFCCLGELPRFMSFPSFPIYSLGLEVLLSVLLALIGSILIWLARRFFGFKPNLLLLCVFALLSVGVLIGTFAIPESVAIPYGTHEVFVFSTTDKCVYALSSLASFFGLWVFLSIGPIGKNGRPFWFVFYELIVLFALAAIVYSLITEFDVYRDIFRLHSLSDARSPVSWAGQKNAFGRYILVGIIAELTLLYIDRRYYRYVTVVVLFFFLTLTLAKTPLLLGTAFLFGFFVYIGFLEWRARRKIAIAHFAIAGIAALTVIVLFSIPSDYLGGLGSIIASIKSNADIGGGGTIDTRYAIWSHSMEVWGLSGLSRAFGFGDYAFSILIGPAMDMPTYNPTSHNAYIEALGRGGVFRVVLEGIAILYILYRFIKAFRSRRKDAPLRAMVFLLILVHGFLESTFIFDVSYEALCLTALSVIPILSSAGDATMRQPSVKPNSASFVRVLVAILFLALPGITVFLWKLPITWLGVVLGIVSVLVQLAWGLFFSPKGSRLFATSSLCLGNLLAVILAFAFPFVADLDVLGVALSVSVLTVSFFIISELLFPNPLRKDFFNIENLYRRVLFSQQAMR